MRTHPPACACAEWEHLPQGKRGASYLRVRPTGRACFFIFVVHFIDQGATFVVHFIDQGAASFFFFFCCVHHYCRHTRVFTYPIAPGARPTRKQVKRAFQATMMRDLLARFPQLRGRVAHVEVATPLSNKHFLAAPQGASYGLGSTIRRYAGTCA
jgi:phytoene dehydrogenase-like protein